MYLDRRFGLSVSLSEITLLFDLSLYLDQTLAQRKAQRKAKSKVKATHCIAYMICHTVIFTFCHVHHKACGLSGWARHAQIVMYHFVRFEYKNYIISQVTTITI